LWLTFAIVSTKTIKASLKIRLIILEFCLIFHLKHLCKKFSTVSLGSINLGCCTSRIYSQGMINCHNECYLKGCVVNSDGQPLVSFSTPCPSKFILIEALLGRVYNQGNYCPFEFSPGIGLSNKGYSGALMS
jgi:hypothetical protein